jgi:hypothetical protein
MATVCAQLAMRVAFAAAVHGIQILGDEGARGTKALRLNRCKRKKQQSVIFGRILPSSVPSRFGFTPGSEGGALLVVPLDGTYCAAWEGYAVKESHRASGGSAVLHNSSRSIVRAADLAVWRVGFSRAVSLRKRTNNDLGQCKFPSAVRLQSGTTRHHGEPAYRSADWGSI